jgi:hypothetical protein
LEGRRQGRKKLKRRILRKGRQEKGGGEEDRLIRIGKELRGQEVERDEDTQVKSG